MSPNKGNCRTKKTKQAELSTLCVVLEHNKRNSTAAQNIQTNAHCQRFMNNTTNLGSVHMPAVIFVS